MKKTSRIVTLCLAVMLMISCIAIPASATDTYQHRFVCTINGEEVPLTARIYDENGNPVPMSRSIIYDDLNYTMKNGWTLVLDDYGNAIPLTQNSNVDFRVTLRQSGKISFAYRKPSGSDVSVYQATSGKTVHADNFFVPDTSNYRFVVTNIGIGDIIVDSAEIG